MMSEGLSASDVAVLTGNTNNRGCNDGFGWGGEWIWIILLFCLFGWGGFGGGWGGNGGGFNTPSANGALTRAEMFEGFQGQNMNSALNGIRDGQFSIENALCNGFAGINSNISNLGYQLQQCLNRFKKAIMNLFTKKVNAVGTYA